MFPRIFSALIGALPAFVCATAIADGLPLTLAQAVDRAVDRSPDIAFQNANVNAAQAAAAAAGRLPDPKLSLGIENLPVTGEDRFSLRRDAMTMRRIGVMQDVPNRAKRSAETDIAVAAVARAQAGQHLRIREIRRDAAIAWLNRYYVEHRSALLDELDRETALFADAVRAQLAGGRGTPADAIVPKQEAAELADRRDALDGELTKAKAQLERWIGEAALADLADAAPAIDIDAAEFRGRVHEHPELAVYEPMTQMAQAEVRAAEATKRPDWGVGMAYGLRDPAFGNMASVEFTVDLPVFSRSRQNPRIEARRQTLKRVEAERDMMLLDHTRALEVDLAEYETVARQLARMDTVRLPLAQQKVEYQFAGYRGGKGDLAAVLAARRELIALKFDRLELNRQRATAAASLYYLYGEGAR